jgi:hypothetical protein
MFFLLFLLDDRRIRIREAQNHMDPDPDSDPQHWLANLFQISFSLVQIEFFRGGEEPCSVLDEEHGVLFVKKPDGRATGDAFVLFRSPFLRHKT